MAIASANTWHETTGEMQYCFVWGIFLPMGKKYGVDVCIIQSTLGFLSIANRRLDVTHNEVLSKVVSSNVLIPNNDRFIHFMLLLV